MELRVQPRMTANVPWVLVIGVLLTSVVGIYNLASASRPPSSPVWMSQLLYLAVGIAIVVVMAFLDYRLIQRATVALYLLNIGALLALKVFGHTAKGAESWFVAAATVGHALLAVFFSWLTSTAGGQVLSLSGVPLQVILTTLAGLAMWPLLRKIEPGERPEPGLLR